MVDRKHKCIQMNKHDSTKSNDKELKQKQTGKSQQIKITFYNNNNDLFAFLLWCMSEEKDKKSNQKTITKQQQLVSWCFEPSQQQ